MATFTQWNTYSVIQEQKQMKQKKQLSNHEQTWKKSIYCMIPII